MKDSNVYNNDKNKKLSSNFGKSNNNININEDDSMYFNENNENSSSFEENNSQEEEKVNINYRLMTEDEVPEWVRGAVVEQKNNGANEDEYG